MANILDRSIDIGEFISQPDDDIIVCRCEEITKGEIRKAVHMGMWDLTEIRRFLRVGMGLCQGQTCSKLVQGIVAHELNCPPSALIQTTARTPARPVEMKVFANEIIDAEEVEK